MKHARQTIALIGALIGALVLVITVILLTAHPKSISVQYLGLRKTPWPGSPNPLFLITNPTSYRLTWTMLAPEFKLASGWTTTQVPKVSIGGRTHDLRFGGKTLLPGASFEIYGMAPTNVPYRYPILWGLHPADALRRPKWERVVDDWGERIGIGPLLLPHGIQRTPVVAAKPPNQVGAANGSQPVRSQTNQTAAAAHSRR